MKDGREIIRADAESVRRIRSAGRRHTSPPGARPLVRRRGRDCAVLGVERSYTGIPVALLATLGQDPTYVGNAMVTLPAADRKRFWTSVETMGAPQARLAGFAKNKKATWIREGLVARVRHLRGEDKLRHATLQSLDVDKSISDNIGERHGDAE